MSEPSEIVVRDGRLYHLGIAQGEVARQVFLVGDPARAYKVAARFASIEHEVKHREYVTLTGKVAGRALSVIGTGIGTDNVEIALIELHAAHALELESGCPLSEAPRLDLIRIGTSGGVQADVPAGTLCIAEYALGLDATGPYYAVEAADAVVDEIEGEARRLLEATVDPQTRFFDRIPVYASKASAEAHQALLSSARAQGVAHASGITVSSPGFYGPSSRYIEGLVNTVPDIKGTLARLSVAGRRVLNMEMESSVLFHLAGALGHRASAICPAISQPNTAAAIVDYEDCIESAIDVAVSAMAVLRGSAS